MFGMSADGCSLQTRGDLGKASKWQCCRGLGFSWHAARVVRPSGRGLVMAGGVGGLRTGLSEVSALELFQHDNVDAFVCAPSGCM
mmetsp:Transcript_56711/g.183731  ORF Transcript_56711/g.183731 Transcript_56711/m.183731 type:complete len:85 (+) Transcript_56711:3089-3343(+)